MAGSWLFSREVMERMTANLSAWRAVRGRCSQTWIPGTFVGIGLKVPRISAGASGFMSKVS